MKDEESFIKINQILHSSPIGRIRKYIANTMLYCHLCKGGVAGVDIMEKFKEIKKFCKRHRGAADILKADWCLKF